LHETAVLFDPCSLSDRPYLVASRVCDRYPFKVDLLLPCDTSSFSLLSLEHVGEFVRPLSSVVVVAKSHVLTYDCYYHSVQQSFESNTSCLAYL